MNESNDYIMKLNDFFWNHSLKAADFETVKKTFYLHSMCRRFTSEKSALFLSKILQVKEQVILLIVSVSVVPYVARSLSA